MPGRTCVLPVDPNEKSQDNVWTSTRWQTNDQEAFDEKEKEHYSTENKNGILQMVKDNFADFTEESSFHGVKYVGGTKYHFVRRVVWTILFLVAAAGVTIIVKNAVETYYRKPVQTKLSIQYKRAMQFPTVTLCNFNRYRATQVAYQPNLTQILKTLYPVTAADHALNLNWSDPVFAPYLDGRGYLSFALSAGHQLQNMFWNCYWKGQQLDCNEVFKQVITDFGVCYQFNSNGTLNASRSGAANGLWLRINIEHWDYYYGDSSSAGMKLLLHRHDETPLVKELGYGISPGTETLVSLQVKQIESKPPPYEGSECVDTKSADFVNHLAFYDSYSLAGCRQECITNFTLQQCGCRDVFDIGPGYPCPAYNYSCVREAHDNYTIDNTAEDECNCNVPCSETLFEYRTSSAIFPNNYVAQEFSKSYNLTKEFVRDNFLDLRIFYEKLNYDLVEQVPSYGFMDLFADIGGNMGLCLGASCLTLYEWFEHFALSVFGIFYRLCWRSENKRKTPVKAF